METAEFQLRVLKTFSDPLSRQIHEAVAIRRYQEETLNSKAEFNSMDSTVTSLIQDIEL